MTSLGHVMIKHNTQMTVGSAGKLIRIHGLGLPSSDDGPPLLSQSIGRHGDCSCDDDRDPVKVNMFQKKKEKKKRPTNNSNLSGIFETAI